MNESLKERFWSKVSKNGPIPENRPELGPCWQWIGGVNSSGYGQFYIERQPHRSHIISYRLIVGKVPEGLELDHLCRNRRCVRPTHLEPVTHRVNCLRGISPAAICAQKTECSKGHPFTVENTYVDRLGKRHCRTCRKAANKKWVAEISPERAEELRAYNARYRARNREKIVLYLRKYYAQKRKVS